MRRALVVLALFACKSKHEGEKPPSVKMDQGGSDEGKVVQPRFSNGEAAPTDEGHLGFTITKVTLAGDTTTIEAHVDGDPAAKFAFRMPRLAEGGDGPGFSRLHFVPTTREAGTRVIAALAKTLRVTVPPVTSGGELQPLKVPIAVLGHNIGRLDNGLGGRGTWDATKLFCSAGAIEAAELFFNFSTAEKRGEFSEKDTDYNQDVVTCLAAALRDGLPPARSAANDPTLATSGPRLELGKQIGKGRIERVALTPLRILVTDERGTGAALVEVDPKTGASKDLYVTHDRLEYGNCDATATRCVIKESTPGEERNVFGGKDKARFVLLEGTTVRPLQLPPGDVLTSPAHVPVSPDGKYVVIESGASGSHTLTAMNLATKQTVVLTGRKEDEQLDVLDWVKDGDRWIAVVMRGSYDDKVPAVAEWHLDAKGAVKPSKRKLPEYVPSTSPDGTRRADFTQKGKLAVTVGATRKTLVFHPDDAKYVGENCCPWIDNRFLRTSAGFIDTDAMKVSLLPGDDDERPRVEVLSGTRTAIVIERAAGFFATIVGP